jgi:O-antigen/teichoic acid export membrane protein
LRPVVSARMTVGGPEELLDTPAAGPRVVRGGVMRLAGHLAGALLTVASSAVVIRHLGVVDTGRFVTVVALVTIVGSISDLGLSAFGVREYSVRSRDEGHRLLRNVLGMRLVFALLGLAAAVAFAAATDYTRVMVVGTVVAGFGMVLFVVQQSQAIPLHVRLRFGWVAALALLLQAGVAVGAVILAVAGASLLPFFALQLAVMAPILVLTAVIGGRETRVLPAVDIAEWRRMLARILPYSAAVVLSVLYFRVAQIMVSLLSTDVQTGYFGVSFRVLEAITMIPPLVVSSALPILSRAAINDSERFAYAARRVTEVMLIAGVGVALILFLGAEIAVDVVAGAGFDPAVEVLRILAIALVGTFVIAARGYALLSLDRTRAILVSNAIALGVVFAAGVPLIQAHGAKGGAIALVAAELTLAACYELTLTARSRDVGVPVGFVARVALAGLVATVPLMLLGPPPLAMVAIGAAVYVGALLAFGALPADLRRDLLAGRHASGATIPP